MPLWSFWVSLSLFAVVLCVFVVSLCLLIVVVFLPINIFVVLCLFVALLCLMWCSCVSFWYFWFSLWLFFVFSLDCFLSSSGGLMLLWCRCSVPVPLCVFVVCAWLHSEMLTCTSNRRSGPGPADTLGPWPCAPLAQSGLQSWLLQYNHFADSASQRCYSVSYLLVVPWGPPFLWRSAHHSRWVQSRSTKR